MGYHPETMVYSFPPIALDRDGWLKRAFYRLSPWIGFDIWHIEPERRVEGPRRDDSCGWFDRRPHEYADAVKAILYDKGEVQAIRNAMDRAVHQPAGFGNGWRRMTPADCLAATLMVAIRLEHLRRWGRQNAGKWFTRDRRQAAERLAYDLALNETDNLQTSEEVESFILSIASALHRRHKPWWRHPRWHVHHWRVNFHLTRNLRRARERCATCGKKLGFGYCPTQSGGKLHHGECLGHHAAYTRGQA